MRTADGTAPLWVSNREAIDALGPLGRAWRTPHRLGVAPGPATSMNDWKWNAMSSENIYKRKDHRRRGGRGVVRLNRVALWKRLAVLNRSQNWLARETGVSPGYMSMLVNGERSPSGRICRRMQLVLGVDDFDQLFMIEEDEHERP